MATYKVIEKIGEGGMGVVYRAQQTALGRDVALKLLLSGEAARPNDLVRFAREVRAIARIAHPNVIRILDYGTIDGRAYYAMDYLGHARTLSQVLKHEPALPIDRVASIARQLLDALSAVHQHGLIHRDIKPGNLMLDDDDHLTLMDFGLVKDLEASSMTRTGMMIGTPRYLAPEAVQAEAVDARADLFAVGVILHEALTGKRLFQGDTLVALAMQIVNTPAPPLRTERRDCPIWLADLVHRLLAKDPAHRPQSAIDALNELRAGRGEPPRPPPAPAPSSPASASGEPLPESTILGGLEALREELMRDDSPTPTVSAATPTERASSAPRTPAPARRPTASHAALGATSRPATQERSGSPSPGGERTAGHPPTGERSRRPLAGEQGSLSQPVSRPGGADAPGRRTFALAGAVFVGVFGLTLFLFMPTFRSQSPSPSSPAPAASPAAPAGADAVARALSEAIHELAPTARIADLRAKLRPLKGFWFRNEPDKRMVELREQTRVDLEARAGKVKLGQLLSSFIPLRGEYFTPRGEGAEERLAMYLLLNDLLDLELFCDRFEVRFAPGVGRAFPTQYGLVTRGALAGKPAAGYAFRESTDGKWFQAPEPAAVTQVADTVRFHGRDDAETTDMMKTLGGGVREHREFEGAGPLFALAGVEQLELSGWCSNLEANAAFEIQLSDGGGWRTVGIVRGFGGDEIRRWWHTVERSLFRGPRLSLRVKFRYLPDMNSGREYGYLYQVQVHHSP